MCETQNLVAEQHPFETAGFGAAPFRLIGITESVYQACPGAPVQPGSSCDYCGQGIRFVFMVRSADGREFKIGGDCAMTQLRKRSNSADKRLVDTVKREINKRRRELAKANASRRIDAARDAFPAIRHIFETAPHPSERAAKFGRTRADYLEWLLKNAGQAGKLRAAREIENALV